MPVDKRPFRGEHSGSEQHPYLYAKFHNPHSGQSQSAYGIVDTGAGDCCLPAEFAELLGHDLERGRPRTVTGVSGDVQAWGHTTIIEIPGFTTQEVVIDFVRGLPIPLFGCDCFLANFVLTVNYPERWFSIKWPAGSVPVQAQT